MPYTVWFIPTNSSHMGKLWPLMVALRDQGHDVQVLCTDEFQLLSHAALPSIEQTGYPFEMLRRGRFRLRHWLLMVWERRHLVPILKKFFAEHPVDALIFGTDGSVFCRTFIRTAACVGVPTVLVPDGYVLPPNPRFRASAWFHLKVSLSVFLGRLLGVHGPRGSAGEDLLLPMNETGREVFVGEGIKPERIRVVGSAEYDALAAQGRDPFPPEQEERLRREIGLPPGQPIVFFAHQHVAALKVQRETVRALAAAARRCHACLVVKLHPRAEEHPADWRAWADSQQMSEAEVKFYLNECTSIELARLCSVCVTPYSTVAIEALIYGKPLVVIQFMNTRYVLDYAQRYGVAIDAHTPQGLEEAVVLALSDDSVRAGLRRGIDGALARELHGMDGRSAQRMTEAVLSLIRERRGARGPAQGPV